MSLAPEDKRRRVRSIVVIRPTLEAEDHQNFLQLSQDAQGGYIIDLCDLESTPSKDSRFAFPAVYGHQAHPLDLLCVQEVEPLLQGCLNGESAAVIAYGETGAGKSYICGTESRPGDPWQGSLGSYLARRLWEAATTKGLSELHVECSMIEIYREKSSKEKVFDLLAGYQRKKVERLYAPGTERIVTTPEALLAGLREGAALRNTDRTDGNARSSRSHAIFTVRVQHTRRGGDGTKERVSGRFLLVDLAGAEAASSAEVGSAQQKQGSGINTGLSALQTVIIEASKGSGASRVVQYRSSMLTSFLKPALGGGEGGGREGCNAVFLGCIKPFAGKGTRTRTTLQYIRQAANIRNVVQADVESVEARRDRVLGLEIEVLKQQNKELAAELQAAREGAGSNNSAPTEVSEVVVLSVSEHQALLREVQEGKDRIIALEVVLKGSEDEHSRLKEQLATALIIVEDAEQAAVVAVATPDVVASIQGGGGGDSAALLALTPAHVGGGSAPQADQLSNASASIGMSPGLAALAVSPILSAARTVDAAILHSLIAQQEPLEIEEICLDEDESHLEPDQLGVLHRLVESRLADAASISGGTTGGTAGGTGGTGTAASTSGTSGTASKGGNDTDQGGGVSTAAVALHRRTAEVAALRLVVAAYNECLGSVSSELENMRIKEAEATAQLHQAAREKVQYVDLTAKFSEALDISQDDVRELQTEVKELRRQSMVSSSPGTNLLGRMTGGLTSVSPKAAEKSDRGGTRSSSRSPRPSIIGPSSEINSADAANDRAAPSSTGTSSRRTSALHALGYAIFQRSSASPAVPSPKAVPSLENAPTIVEEEEEQPSGFEFADFGPARGTSLDAFPLEDLTAHHSDLDLSDDYDYDEAGGCAQYDDDVIDLVDDNDDSGGGADIGRDGGGGVQPSPSVLSAAATASDYIARPQKALENDAREQHMRMQGGVDVGAISGQRGGQLSENFIEKNQHWQPISKRQGRK